MLKIVLTIFPGEGSYAHLWIKGRGFQMYLYMARKDPILKGYGACWSRYQKNLKNLLTKTPKTAYGEQFPKSFWNCLDWKVVQNTSFWSHRTMVEIDFWWLESFVRGGIILKFNREQYKRDTSWKSLFFWRNKYCFFTLLKLIIQCLSN